MVLAEPRQFLSFSLVSSQENFLPKDFSPLEKNKMDNYLGGLIIFGSGRRLI